MTTREQILPLVPSDGAPVRPKQLADATGLRVGTVRQTLRRMVEAGELREGDRYGEYCRAEAPTVPVPGEAPDPYAGATGAQSRPVTAPDPGTVVEFVGPGGVVLRFNVVLERVGEPVRIGVGV